MFSEFPWFTCTYSVTQLCQLRMQVIIVFVFSLIALSAGLHLLYNRTPFYNHIPFVIVVGIKLSWGKWMSCASFSTVACSMGKASVQGSDIIYRPQTCLVHTKLPIFPRME